MTKLPFLALAAIAGNIISNGFWFQGSLALLISAIFTLAEERA